MNQFQLTQAVFHFASSARTTLTRISVRYDAWWLVALAVIIALGATVLIGMAVWCITTGHSSFTGSWAWYNPFTLKIQCKY